MELSKVGENPTKLFLFLMRDSLYFPKISPIQFYLLFLHVFYSNSARKNQKNKKLKIKYLEYLEK